MSTSTPAFFTFQLKNQFPGGKKVYATITGKAIDDNLKWVIIQSDGSTIFNPVMPNSAEPVKIDGNFGIDLGPMGSSTNVTIPRLDSARIYFSVENPLNFFVVGDPNHKDPQGNPAPIPLGIVQPSVVNYYADKSGINYKSQWGFCEFAYTRSNLFVNISYVDFVGLPIALDLTTKSGATQQVKGLAPTGMDSISTVLQAQTARDTLPWGSLAIKDTAGKTIRVLSPNTAKDLLDPNHPAVSFGDYYKKYVDDVFAAYTAPNQITINTQNADYGGDVIGYAQSKDGPITFYGPKFSGGHWDFQKPTTSAIFNCSIAPFSAFNDITGNVSARLAAGFNRSTLLSPVSGHDVQPNGPPQSSYYTQVPTNHYAEILHLKSINLDGLGYAFPYDDIQATGAPFLGGKVESAEPDKFTVTVGGGQWT